MSVKTKKPLMRKHQGLFSVCLCGFAVAACICGKLFKAVNSGTACMFPTHAQYLRPVGKKKPQSRKRLGFLVFKA